MITIIVWQDWQELPTFVVLNGDYSHLNNVVVGFIGDEDRQDELGNLLWDPDTGEPKVKYHKEFPRYVLESGDKYVVIRAGLLP